MTLLRMNAHRLLGLSVAISLSIAGCGDDGGSSAETSSSTGSGSSGAATTTSSTSSSGGSGSTGTSSADTGSSTGSESGSSDSGGSSSSGSSGGSSSSTTGVADCVPLLAEVLVDVEGADLDDHQWVKLVNPCDDDIVLDGYTIGYGGTTYEQDDMMGNPRNRDLTGGMIPAGGCILVGGPASNAANGNPTEYNLGGDFSPDLRTGQGLAGDGVALFDLPPEEVDETTVPIDAVVYGPNNDFGLIDETGLPVAEPHADAPPLSGSIQRTSLDATWVVADVPTPNDCPDL